MTPRRVLTWVMVATLLGAGAVWMLRQRGEPATTTANQATPSQPPASMPAPPAGSKELPASAAGEAELVLKALHDRNMAELGAHVHPVLGLRFSPYIHIDPKRTVVMTAAELPKALEDQKPRRWGSEDGSGDPIVQTFASYYARFVYDRDFLNAPQRRVNEFGSRSTTRPNIREVYPNATVVEAHVPGADPERGGMDWSSLLLVLEEHKSRWYLVALVHDQWTI